jgi:polyisoprenoid-binding protein YceI
MKAISGLRVTVPVAGLRSGQDGLDKNLVQAARAAQHPEITFQLEPQSATAMPSGSGARVTTRGALTVNGTTRQIDVAMDVVPGPEGLVVTGSEELLMSEYGIKPPTMMLGALKTDDKVTVHFRLVLGVESR